MYCILSGLTVNKRVDFEFLVKYVLVMLGVNQRNIRLMISLMVFNSRVEFLHSYYYLWSLLYNQTKLFSSHELNVS